MMVAERVRNRQHDGACKPRSFFVDGGVLAYHREMVVLSAYA